MANLSNIRISSRYATALFDLAVEQQQLEIVRKDIEYVSSLIQSSRELIVVFRSPVINLNKKILLLHELFQNSVSSLTFSFLSLITRKGRIVHLNSIAQSFMKKYMEYKKMKTVYVDSASELDAHAKEQISKKLEQYTGYKIELVTELDKTLIGGFRLRFDDYLLDLSLKKKLLILRKEFEKNIYKRKI